MLSTSSPATSANTGHDAAGLDVPPASRSDAGARDRPSLVNQETVFQELGAGDVRLAGLLQTLTTSGTDRVAFDVAAQALIDHAATTPYFDLPGYMGRHWVRRVDPARPYAARVHQILRSDHDRCLHDHPWDNASFVLKGGYWEIVPGAFQATIEWIHGVRDSRRWPADEHPEDLASEVLQLNEWIQHHAWPSSDAQRPTAAQIDRLHRLGVHWRAPGSYTPRQAESLHRLVVPLGTSSHSLFVMGPKYREWGFLTPAGWVHNVPYVKALGREA